MFVCMCGCVAVVTLHTEGGTLIEAPEVVKHGGYYYLFFAAGRYCQESYSEGVARSKSIWGLSLPIHAHPHIYSYSCARSFSPSASFFLSLVCARSLAFSCSATHFNSSTRGLSSTQHTSASSC